MRFPNSSAHSAASSAIGISEVPAHRTITMPWPDGFARSLTTVPMRASGWYFKPRSLRVTARALSWSRRVMIKLVRDASTRRPIVASCATVLPSPKITSGTPRRRLLWLSSFAKPRSSKGSSRRVRSASAGVSRPAATRPRISRILFSVIAAFRSSSLEQFGADRMREVEHYLAHRASVAAGHGDRQVALDQSFAGLGNMAESFDHQPADGSILVGLRKLEAEALIEFRDRRASDYRERARTYNFCELFAEVVFVFDIADDLFDQIFERQDSGRAAVLI